MSILSRHRSGVFAAALLVALCLPDAGSAADPFYQRLLRDGIQAHDGGDYELAVENLRLACFGLLEEPIALARGLTYLALAQANLEDRAAFTGTFDRILEVERRFEAFSQLDLSPDLRHSLQGWLELWIEFDVLDGVPAFRQAARRQLAARVVDLPVEERRPVLQQLVAAEPERSAWGLQLAELEFQRGDFEAVLAAADQVLAQDPGLGRARCLRGRAGGALELCEQALADLESCDELEGPRSLAALKLRCLVQLRDWQGASALLDRVPRASLRKTPFRQLAREVRRGLKASPMAGPAVPPLDEGPVPGGVATDVATVPPASAPGTPGDSAPAGPAPTEPAPTEPAPTEPASGDSAPTEPAPAEAAPAEPASGDSAPAEPAPAGPAATEPMPEAPRPDDPSAWPPELRSEVERARQLLPSDSRGELETVLAAVRELADRYPQLTEPQHLAAEVAYRLSEWQEAVTYFERGGEPGLNHPDRLFYLAVALFEVGDRAAARENLERCLPSLERTPFVRSYVGKILQAGHEEPSRVQD